MICKFCGEDDRDDLLHAATCDGQQGRVEAAANVFDAQRAKQLKAAGQVAQIANPDRKAVREKIWRHVHTLAGRPDKFSSDPVYALAAEEGDPIPDGSPMGSVFTAAHKQKLIEPTGRHLPSARANSHRRMIQEWRGVRAAPGEADA